MVLQKQELDGKVNVTYNSSNILASTYDTATKDLTITFKVGSRYKYPNVNQSDYLLFEGAESQGVVFNTHIKKYSFEKLDAIDPSGLVTEMARLKEEAKKAVLTVKKNKVVNTIIALGNVLADGPNDSITQDDLDTILNDGLEKLKVQIADYLPPTI